MKAFCVACVSFEQLLRFGRRGGVPPASGTGAGREFRVWSSAVCVLALSLAAAKAADFAGEFDRTTETVGRHAGAFQTPVNQILTPAGTLTELPGMRPNALALSPDGKLLVTAGHTHELVVLDPVTGQIQQRVEFPADRAPSQSPVSPLILQPDQRPQLSFTGLKFSPDGRRIYLANVNGDIKVFGVGTGGKVSALYSIPLPPAHAPRRVAEIPSGIAVSPDGKKLYVALNLSNRLGEFDAATGEVLRLWDVGVAPFEVALAGGKIYVSNWGGRRPDADSVVGPAGRGTLVRVDARSIASEGSISIIRPAAERTGETQSPPALLTGLHPCALAVSPNGRWLVVANAGSDTLSVIDTRSDRIVATICARQNPGDPFGAQPNALAFDKRGTKLFACNGTQNAVAVFQFKPEAATFLGLIPVGWFPDAIAFNARQNEICVANIKHFSPGRRRSSKQEREFNTTHQYYGSLSFVRVPSTKDLARYTRTALANLRYPLLAQAKLPPRPGVPPRPVPERVGEPSVFHHVIYVIKENCAYDQVLGDIQEGNGAPDLCVYGERMTPNQHKLVREFALLDNTYCSGILSADGHEWVNSAMATDYLERSFAGWPRSYPAGNNPEERDALAYSPAGFIWDNVLAHGRTLRDFGEFTLSHVRWKDPARTNAPGFLDCYHDFLGGSNAIDLWCEPSVEPLRACLETNTVGWALNVPDQYRARQFIRALRDFEKTGRLPDFIILWLPNDHTSGTRPGCPTPAAQVADNDLAFGQVVEAVSRSVFWKDTCIFAIEDDPQNGWDHVSGYRTTAYVASPYTKRHAVIHTQYNHTSLLRTMELILGLPPMNQMDATATPLFDCFTDVPDWTPFTAVSNNVPLDQMNPEPKKISDRQLRKDAYVSARLPLDKEDQCPEELFREILWRAAKGSHAARPAWARAKGGSDPD